MTKTDNYTPNPKGENRMFAIGLCKKTGNKYAFEYGRESFIVYKTTPIK